MKEINGISAHRRKSRVWNKRELYRFVALTVIGGLLIGILTQFVTSRSWLSDPTWFLWLECSWITFLTGIGTYAIWKI